MSYSIREATKDDVTALTGLTSQLGYPLTENVILNNLDLILQNNNETLFVAIHDNKVMGWIGVYKSVHLTTGPLCEITGLVVDAMHHRKGVGRKLIERAKQWSKEQGENLLRVRANVIRKEAHQFYLRQGFKEMKEQKVFEMTL